MYEKIKNIVKENFDTALDTGSTILGGLFSNALVGQVAPGIATVYLGYKQKRFERNINALGNELKVRIEKLESSVNNLSNKEVDFLEDHIIPIIIDNVQDEQQEEKIKFMINGLETIIEYRIFDEDLILTYFDILKSLRYKDLKVFISLYNYEKTSVSTLSEVKKESLPVSNSEEALENHIIKKLKSYNLLTYQKLYGDFTTDEYKIGADRIKIGMLGRNFVEFIKSKG